MTTTISNQLCLLMLCEKYLDHEIRIISANTDGVLILYTKDQADIVKRIDEWWQKETEHTLEYTPYKLFAQTSVNDYIAVKPDGEVKYKGDFDPFKEIHKDHSFRIIPFALSEYFTKDIPVEHTIYSHNDIFDFCGRFKATQGWWSEVRYIKDSSQFRERLQKTNRYYISTNGSPYYKCHEDGREEAIDKGFKVTIFNDYVEQKIDTYNINHRYYIRECNRILDVVEDKQLKLF